MYNEELVLAIRNGETDKLTQLYEKNTGIIKKIASRYKGLEDSEDLMQEGYFGLVRAVELWRPEYEVKFITYAGFWIRQAMQNYIVNCSGLIRVPADQKAMMYRYNKTVNSIRLRFGRDPSETELMASLGISSEQLKKLRKDILTQNTRSTAEPIGDDGDSTLEDILPDDSSPIEDVIDKIQNEELSRELMKQVEALPENEAEVIKRRFWEESTLKQCGDVLGVSVEYIRQLENSALNRLRKPKVTKQLRPYLTRSTAYSVGIASGLDSFRRSGLSAQERAIILLERNTGEIWKTSPYTPF